VSYTSFKEERVLEAKRDVEKLERQLAVAKAYLTLAEAELQEEEDLYRVSD
jgi:hypothetical protein